MKNSLILLILVITIVSCKKDDVDYPDRITVEGIVIDTSNNLLSKVDVSIMEDPKEFLSGSYTLDIQRTDYSGKFKFEFKQNKESSYELRFSKQNFSLEYESIDRSKEYQYFEVTLNSFIPRTFPGDYLKN